MKTRTIEELHDSKIGHKKFAKIVDGLIERDYVITDIKEYNEQFKFKANGHEYTFRKEWKSSAKEFINYFDNVYQLAEELRKKKCIK